LEESKALKRLKDKLTKENLWLYVIKELSERPMYAYQVKVSLREKYGINVATVTVYTVLYKMEREGLIVKVRSGDDKLYTPTERGLEQFKLGLDFIREVSEKLRGVS